MIVQSWQHYKGEITGYSVDWGVKVGRLSTTVTGVVWSVESGSATVSNDILSGSEASALVSTSSEGSSLIKLTATLADGQTDVFFFKVKTKDPACIQSSSGRY